MLTSDSETSISSSALHCLVHGNTAMDGATATMRRIAILLCTATLALPLHAGSTLAPEKIYAQELVNRTIAKYPDLLAVAMHVTPPKGSQNEIIASNFGRIGKKADAEDMKVINTGETLSKVNKNGDRFEVELLLHDASLKPIGALAIVFPYKAGDDSSQFVKRAEVIRDELAKQIPRVANLMERVSTTR
jgi:hypothetical protein